MNVDPEGHAWWEWLVAAAVVVVCAVAAVATAGAVVFSKGFGPRTGHNQHERQMWNEAKRLRNIQDKDLAQRIHHRNVKRFAKRYRRYISGIWQKIIF